jgi:hypothetical protein
MESQPNPAYFSGAKSSNPYDPFSGGLPGRLAAYLAGAMNQAQTPTPDALGLSGNKSSAGMDRGSDDSGSQMPQWFGSPRQAAESNPVRLLSRRILNPTPAFDFGSDAAPLAPSDDPSFAPDDEREQADIRALDARLSSSGNIRDAVALYNALRSRWS